MNIFRVRTPTIEAAGSITREWIEILCATCGLDPGAPKPFETVDELMQFAALPKVDLHCLSGTEEYATRHEMILLAKFINMCTVIPTRNKKIVGYDPTGAYPSIMNMVRVAFNTRINHIQLKQLAIRVCWLLFWIRVFGDKSDITGSYIPNMPGRYDLRHPDLPHTLKDMIEFPVRHREAGNMGQYLKRYDFVDSVRASPYKYWEDVPTYRWRQRYKSGMIALYKQTTSLYGTDTFRRDLIYNAFTNAIGSL